jgi:SNF2 family DNA or RNA helicase
MIIVETKEESLSEFIDVINEQWKDRNIIDYEVELFDESTIMELERNRDEIFNEAINPVMVVPLLQFGIVGHAIANYFYQGSDLQKTVNYWSEIILAAIFARVKWDESEKTIYIKGIDPEKLITRVDEMYTDKKFSKIFTRNYNFFKRLTYNWKIKSKLKLDDVKNVKFHHFFALETAKIFEELNSKYGFAYYEAISAMLWKRTWLKNFIQPPDVPLLSLSNLSRIKSDFTLKDYQQEFIQQYPALKAKLYLRGTILSFDQGLGKTLTAISLAECLDKKRIYIVCPNTLKENWVNEIRKYFDKYSDPELFKREVYAHDIKGQEYSGKDTKYVIVNNEAMEKVFSTLVDAESSSSMLIVDEVQNFRNLSGSRTSTLVSLRDQLGCDDVLPMSGTPIKAAPNEIVPVLLLIDKLFDLEAAKMYNSLFALDDIATKNIVRERFGKIIYRKTKDQVLALPKKHELQIAVDIKDEDKYTLTNVKDIVNQRFYEIYSEKLKTISDLRKQYIEYVEKYSKSNFLKRDKYLNWVKNFGSYNTKADWHELTLNDMEVYSDTYVLPNIPVEYKKEYQALHMQVLTMRRSAMGEAVGEIVPKYRAQMYLDMYKENRNEFIKWIKENPHKTVIFSVFLDVIKYIHEDLKNEVGSVLVIGGTKDRINLIEQFKNSDDVDVICATSQTMSTGVTITEATQMFFFGPPWRKTDFDQCADRIHRIGQKNEVYIYNVTLSTLKPTLSSRMQDILNWSDKMFGTMIDNKDNF